MAHIAGAPTEGPPINPNDAIINLESPPRNPLNPNDSKGAERTLPESPLRGSRQHFAARKFAKEKIRGVSRLDWAATQAKELESQEKKERMPSWGNRRAGNGNTRK